jgi:hypothetical protein
MIQSPELRAKGPLITNAWRYRSTLARSRVASVRIFRSFRLQALPHGRSSSCLEKPLCSLYPTRLWSRFSPPTFQADPFASPPSVLCCAFPFE